MPDRRLQDYLPPVLQAARALRVLLERGQQPETDTLWDGAETLWAEQFVGTATAYGLSRWEGMMKLPPSGSLEERREAVLARLREIPPFTMRSLTAALEALCESVEIALDPPRYTLRVRVAPASKLAAARALLARRLPANILLDLDILRQSHGKLGGYRHRELTAFTHRAAREI